MISNVHERRLSACPEQVWDLVGTLSSDEDRLWPRGWPAVRLDGPRPYVRTRWVRGLLALRAPRPRPVPVPVPSAACEALPRVDWSDAYRMTLRAGAPQDPDVWRELIFGAAGRRSRLLRLRIALGRLLRRGAADPGPGPDGPFPVLGRSAGEVLVGMDDRHLSFRVTVAVDRSPGDGVDLVVTTAVLLHNAWGRRYMAVVAPFHRRVVPAMMRRAAAGAPTAVQPARCAKATMLST